MIAACRGKINENGYQDFCKQCDKDADYKVLGSFFEFLAGLTLEDQESCFEAIVCTLRNQGNLDHIIQPLKKGKLKLLLLFPMKLRKIRILLIIGKVKSVKRLRGTCTRNFCVYLISCDLPPNRSQASTITELEVFIIIIIITFAFLLAPS